MLLSGKTAVISGAAGARGIGLATARRFAAEGARVAILDLDAGQATAAAAGLGPQHLGLACDVTDRDACAEAAARCIAAFGRIDSLVNNAGVTQPVRFMDIDADGWNRILDVNLRGTLLLSQAFVPQMVAKGKGGAFVAMSGISTHVGTPNRCHVSASKSGLEGLMRALARELAPHRITCNAVAPGAIDTTRAASAGPRPTQGRPIPVGRFGTVEEIAAMVRLLVGPEDTFITGQTIHVNGGEFQT